MGDEDLRTVWVGNLDVEVSDAILYELFLQAGPLQYVRRPKDKNFAFVCYIHECSVPYAIQLVNGIKLCNRELKVQNRTLLQQQEKTGIFGAGGIHSLETLDDSSVQKISSVMGNVPLVASNVNESYSTAHYDRMYNQQDAYSRQNCMQNNADYNYQVGHNSNYNNLGHREHYRQRGEYYPGHVGAMYTSNYYMESQEQGHFHNQQSYNEYSYQSASSHIHLSRDLSNRLGNLPPSRHHDQRPDQHHSGHHSYHDRNSNGEYSRNKRDNPYNRHSRY